MTQDVLTMIWKELRGTLKMPTPGSVISGSKLDSVIAPLGPVVLLGIIVPLRAGQTWITSTLSLIAIAWFPLFLMLTVIADSFAGERERHTLEALLATRLSDQAILLGKIVSPVIYACVQVAATVTVGLITVNVVYGRGKFLMFAARDLAALMIFTVLLGIFVACGGVLVSLRAATVQQAARNLVFAFLAVVLGAIFLASPKIWPAEWRAAVISAVFGGSWLQTEVAVALLLAALDLALFGAARARFRRGRLMLV
jgi:ABC-2 type transport system permease protein